MRSDIIDSIEDGFRKIEMLNSQLMQLFTDHIHTETSPIMENWKEKKWKNLSIQTNIGSIPIPLQLQPFEKPNAKISKRNEPVSPFAVTTFLGSDGSYLKHNYSPKTILSKSTDFGIDLMQSDIEDGERNLKEFMTGIENSFLENNEKFL